MVQKKSVSVKKDGLSNNYFLYRDSLTGCMCEMGAIKEFKKIRNKPGYGGIMIRLKGAENMPLYKGERFIKETSDILNNIYKGNIYRIKYGDFMIFTENFKSEADKINFILYRLQDENRQYAVGGAGFYENDMEYAVLKKTLAKAVGLAEYNGCKMAIY